VIKTVLAGAAPALVQVALRDAQEHLRAAARKSRSSPMIRRRGLVIVGPGEARLKDVSLAPWRHRAFALVHGVLELTLEPGSYGWRFIATNGEVLDRGDSRCRRQVQS
jgi:hypothetical protein